MNCHVCMCAHVCMHTLCGEGRRMGIILFFGSAHIFLSSNRPPCPRAQHRRGRRPSSSTPSSRALHQTTAAGEGGRRRAGSPTGSGRRRRSTCRGRRRASAPSPRPCSRALVGFVCLCVYSESLLLSRECMGCLLACPWAVLACTDDGIRAGNDPPGTTTQLTTTNTYLRAGASRWTGLLDSQLDMTMQQQQTHTNMRMVVRRFGATCTQWEIHDAYLEQFHVRALQ